MKNNEKGYFSKEDEQNYANSLKKIYKNTGINAFDEPKMSSKEALDNIYHCYNVNASDYDYGHGQVDCTKYFNKVESDLEILDTLKKYFKVCDGNHCLIFTSPTKDYLSEDFYKLKSWLEDIN